MSTYHILTQKSVKVKTFADFCRFFSVISPARCLSSRRHRTDLHLQSLLPQPFRPTLMRRYEPSRQKYNWHSLLQSDLSAELKNDCPVYVSASAQRSGARQPALPKKQTIPESAFFFFGVRVFPAVLPQPALLRQPLPSALLPPPQLSQIPYPVPASVHPNAASL